MKTEIKLTPTFSIGSKADAEKWMKGLDLAEFLGLQKIDRGNLPCGFNTAWGIKSALELYESIRIIVTNSSRKEPKNATLRKVQAESF